MTSIKPVDRTSLPVSPGNEEIPLPSVSGLSAAVLLGAAAGIALLLGVIPALATSASGPEPKVYWYLSRSSAIVSYVLLWLSTAFGLLISTKLSRSWPGAGRAVLWHQDLTLAGLGTALFHALVLLGDRFIGFSPTQLLVPFASGYQPVMVGLGQLALYLGLAVWLSFYFRARIGTRAWRLLHYLGFVVVLLALLHGIGSGSDSANRWVATLYWATGGGLLFLTLARLLLKGVPPAKARAS
ncbi:MAG: hypothetical protein U0556_07760 [Dehalococcoidia bacterium]